LSEQKKRNLRKNQKGTRKINHNKSIKRGENHWKQGHSRRSCRSGGRRTGRIRTGNPLIFIKGKKTEKNKLVGKKDDRKRAHKEG